MSPYSVDQIVQYFPAAWKLLLDWHLEQVAPRRSGVEELDQVAKNFSANHEKILKNLIYYTVPRFLYDFFDCYELKMFVREEYRSKWLFEIVDGPEESVATQRYDSRTVAEEAGFYQAFALLNKRLNKRTDGE
jgi:hypothetical protein